MLNTQYSLYERKSDGRVLVRAPQWSLPEFLLDHIETIQPTSSFFCPVAQKKRAESQTDDRSTKDRLPTYEEMVEDDLVDHGHLDIPDPQNFTTIPTAAQACNRLAVSPFCIRTLYGTIEYECQNSKGNGIGIVNFNGQSNNRSDLEMFLNKYQKDAAAANAAYTFKTEIVNNGVDQQTRLETQRPEVFNDLEGALDIQTAIGVGFPVPVTAYNVGGKPQYETVVDNEPYLEWLHYVLAQDQLPPVISISYADEEHTIPEAYAIRVCNEFSQLGARGVSVILASGDNGVGQHCEDDDASCPFVTAVGATRLEGSEVVAFDARGGFVSGGGFSNYFSRPSYQKEHVEGYIRGLDAGLSPYFNSQGRGYPDVSAIGCNYLVMWDGATHLQDGTSASAPSFAAIVAMVNDALLAVGRPTLGFLNPLLYSRGAAAFKDVVSGSSFGCNTTGFPAARGWDAASGLGTPLFSTLKDIALRESFVGHRPWYMGG
ncbi:subtilisin-like protein [Aureobasidium sp. EXF-8845]|nr:subtilisin-like protein [Aureobasidium sp. EXF-8845]